MVASLTGSPSAVEAARRVLIVAGEPSGDLHAAHLVRALRGLGSFDVRGVAGPRMRAEGVEPLVAQESLAVIGFSGILARLPALLAARRALLRAQERWRPDAVVLVDYPGFNLRLGPELKRRGARVFYYIGPQVWAWHPGRAREMARWVDRLAVVFPFEEPIFRGAGVPTTFVGHPLLDELAPETDEATLRREIGAAADAPIVGLLPGSRRGELAQHAGVMLDAAQRLRREHPRIAPVLALAEGLSRESLPAAALEGVAVVRGRTRAVQAFAACCAVASGTATLETALFATPHVICYHVGRLNFAIAKRLVKLSHIGLPNIVAGREVAPELIQDAFSAGALAGLLGGWLSAPATLARRRAELAVVRERLGGPGASERAARAVVEVLA